MVKVEVIRKRLNKLDGYLKILEEIKKYSFEEFISDPEHFGSAERFLQLSIEIVNDIGNHIVADEDLGMVNWQSDIPEILNGKKIVPDSLKLKWIKIIGFRIDFIIFPFHLYQCCGIINEQINLLVYSVSSQYNDKKKQYYI